jgi:hydrogenase maturation protease
MVDALPGGEKPGTLSVIEPYVGEEEGVTLDTHGMDPAKVLAFAQALGAEPARTLVVGCEPETVIGGEDYEEMVMELSQPVRTAVEEAVKLVESLVEELGEAESGAEPGKGKGGDSV